MFNDLKSIPWRFVPIIIIFYIFPFIMGLVHFNLDNAYQSVYHETTSSVTPLYFTPLGCGIAYNRLYISYSKAIQTSKKEN